MTLMKTSAYIILSPYKNTKMSFFSSPHKVGAPPNTIAHRKETYFSRTTLKIPPIIEGFPQTMGGNVTVASLRAREEKADKNL